MIVKGSLQVVLNKAVTASQLSFFASWTDENAKTSIHTFTRSNNAGRTNSQEAVDVIPSDLLYDNRTVNFISISNSDTASAKVTLRIKNGTSYSPIRTITLLPNESLEYTEGGFRVVDENGILKVTTSGGSLSGTAGGELSGTYPNPTLVNDAVIQKTLTAYASAAGVVDATDNIIGAIQKLDGNIGALVTGVSSVNSMTGAVPLTGTSNRITISGSNVFDIGTSVVTLTGAQALSNKTGNISQWTNDSNYISLASALSGLSVAGSTITSSSTIISAFGALQNQINGILGGAIYISTWAASTNTPTLADGAGTKGNYYVASDNGVVNFGSGVIDFHTGDWAIYNGTIWQKVDNTDAVASVNGGLGAVVITTTGTAGRITVSGGGGLTPTIDISSTYVGQATITTLGTITTGTWNGSAISDTYISSAATWNAKQAALVSGTNIKTINSTSLLGSGDIAISAAPGGSNTQIQYNNSSAFGGISTITTDGSLMTFTAAGIGTTPTNRVVLTNTTAAISGTQQFSPAIEQIGQGWKTTSTAASQQVAFRSYVTPVQGTTNPTAYLGWGSNINSAGYTERMLLDSDGNLTINSARVAATGVGTGTITTSTMKELQVAGSTVSVVRILSSNNNSGKAGVVLGVNDGSSTNYGQLYFDAATNNTYLQQCYNTGYLGLGANGRTTDIVISAFFQNIGLFGITAPTSRLHLPAGTATANTAPLQFNTGTNETTARAGVMEYNNTFHLTNSDATRRHIVLAPNTTKVTAGAPYTNDGYIVMNIGGTDFKLMTTA